MCLLWSTAAVAATEVEKLAAVQNGLAHLYSTQQPGGYWSYYGYEPACTGAAAFAFLSQKAIWGPNAVQYQTATDRAIRYLLGAAATTTVGARDDGLNPCGSGTCLGIYWPAANNEITYTTGLIAPALALYGASDPGAIATASGPLAGLTWIQIAQGITNLFAASQTTATGGNRRGGWRYYPTQHDSDMSTTQWAVLSLIYGRDLGATTPQFVKDELRYWLAAVQVSGHGGAACYQPDYLICDHSDTGGLLLSLFFVGDPVTDPAVQAALGFLNSNWTQTATSEWYGNFGHPYAMWSVYKGLDVNIGLRDNTYITNRLTTCGAPNSLPGDPPGSVPCNWWEDYSEWLVRHQNADGSWTGYSHWVDPLSTAFNVGVLGATPVCVPIDGVCGSANGQGFPTAPTSNLCAVGTPSEVTGTGPWTWTCTASSCGAPATCSAAFGCAGAPDGTPCDDASLCTTGDACHGGACVGGNPVVCTAPSHCSVAGNCDPSTGLCSEPTAAPDGTPCDNDGNCWGGVCNHPPSCGAAGPTVSVLWPPNHEFVRVGVVGVTDPNNDPLVITIVAITQDEPLKGEGTGNTCPDGAGVGSATALVRSERSGQSDGRVYHVSYAAGDGHGGTCTGEVMVCVPHDQSSQPACEDGGGRFDSTGPCTLLERRGPPPIRNPKRFRF